MRNLPKWLHDPQHGVDLFRRSKNYVVLDFEVDTSHGDYGHPAHPANQLLLACWKLGPGHPDAAGPMGTHTHAKWGNELEQSALLGCLSRADFLVAHNAKYELGWLRRMGADLHDILPFDTKLGEYVLLGNLAAGSADQGMPRLSTSLDMCCRRRALPIKDPAVDIMIGNGINPVRIPRPWLEGRCRQDVETTEQVFLSQRSELDRRGLLPVQLTRCILTPVLADIESEGMGVDPQAVEAAYQRALAKQRELQEKMDALTGGANTRSPQQMAKLLYVDLGFEELKTRRGDPKRNSPTKAFPAGAPLTDSDTIEALPARTAAQREFKALHKELSKSNALLSKNLEFFRGVAEERGCIFHGEILQTSTATHRTSSRGMPITFTSQLDERGHPITRRVQFQNMPRQLKPLICPKRGPDWLMAEPDGSQIEFRVAAILGNDATATADIVNPDFDAHRQTAAQLFSITQEEVAAEEKEAKRAHRDSLRQEAKPDTFKPLYGGRYGTPEQERYYKFFRERYAGISATQDRWVQEAVETKRHVTAWGLIYYWPNARRDSRGRVNCETAVDNYDVQALATAEIMPVAVAHLWHRVHAAGLDDRIRIVNIVHDSAPSEVHKSAVEEFKEITKCAFTTDVYKYIHAAYGLKFSAIPLGVGIKIGQHWGEGEEVAFDIYSNGKEVKRK